MNFIKWLINFPAYYAASDERLHRFMGMTLFLFNLFIQVYVFIKGIERTYFIEIISINYAVILVLMGIRGYFEAKNVKVNTQNPETENNKQ